MKIITIPVPEQKEGYVECPSSCPFYSSSDVSWGCNIGAADRIKKFPERKWSWVSVRPGQECPGPGVYELKKITKGLDEKESRV